MTATPEPVTRGDYLFFEVGESRFCAPVDEVQAIVELNEIHGLPFAPRGVIGTFLFRERIAVVCDLSVVFNVEAGAAAQKNLSVVVSLSIGLVAFRVDHVSDIVPGSEVRLQVADRRALKEWMDGYVMRGPDIAFLTTFEKLLKLFGIEQLPEPVHGIPGAQEVQALAPGMAQPAANAERDSESEPEGLREQYTAESIGAHAAHARSESLPEMHSAPAEEGALAERSARIDAEEVEIDAGRVAESVEAADALPDSGGEAPDSTVEVLQAGLEQVEGAAATLDSSDAEAVEFAAEREGERVEVDDAPPDDSREESGDAESDSFTHEPYAEADTVWEDEPAVASAVGPIEHQQAIPGETEVVASDGTGSQDAEVLPMATQAKWPPDQAQVSPARSRRRVALVLLALLLIIVLGWWFAKPDPAPQPAEVRKSAPVQAVTPQPAAEPQVAREPAPEKIEIIGKEFEMRVERASQEKGAQPLSTVPGSADEAVHVVQRGDTLWDIAARHLGNPYRYPELARSSAIRNPNLIHPGDVVRMRKRR